jgi:hypothetical protein
MRTIQEINAWLDQALKREEAQEKADEEFQRTGKVALPPASEWQQYPCDVCPKYVGEDGHIELRTAERAGLKSVYLSVHCHTCHEYFLKRPIFPVK